MTAQTSTFKRTQIYCPNPSHEKTTGETIPSPHYVVKSTIFIYEDSYFQTGTKAGVPELIHAHLGAPEELDRKIGFYAKPWSLASFTNKK